jgi:hypothetical protein
MVYRQIALAAFAAAAPLSAAAQSNLPTPIEAQELRALDAWSVSALARGDGALGADLWSRTEPEFLAQTLDRLPSTYDSPAAQNLARRVLLSGGDAPRGDAAEASRKRFEALGRMGQADALAQMAAGAGNALADPAIATYAAQAELARGRRGEACARGRSANVGEAPPPFLLRLRAYCAASDGDRAAADLALEFSRGARPASADDNWYAAAIAAVGGAPPARAPNARYDNSLSAQLSIAAQFRPGPNPLNDASTLALAAIARNEAAPQPQRAQAAALSFRRGAISAAEARAILLATPAEITSALPPIVTALRAVEAARNAPPPPPAPTLEGGAPAAPAINPAAMQAGLAIAEALRTAANPADFAAVAHFFKADIAALPAAPDPAAAVLFTRAAIATGDARLGQRMVTSLRQNGLAPATLAPLDAALAALGGVRGDAAVRALHQRIDGGGGAAAARDVAILAALGAPTDGQVQRFMLANAPQGGARAHAGAMLALMNAVDRGASGEAALLAVAAAGEAGPARLDAESLTQIIRALRTLRLEDDARAFAAEAILAGAPQ